MGAEALVLPSRAVASNDAFKRQVCVGVMGVGLCVGGWVGCVGWWVWGLGCVVMG